MTARDDLDRQLDAFLRDGPTELPEPSFYAVRARTESARQRVVVGPWRMPDMNKLMPIGLGAAAVVVALVVGTQFLGRAAPSGVGLPAPTSPSPSPTPDPSPSPTAWTGLAAGPFVVTSAGDAVQVTLDIASQGWSAMTDFDAVTKNDDGLDAPQSVGAALLAWTWPAGTEFDVYGDPCHWQTTIPTTPVKAADEIAAAFAAQASSAASAPVDVTVGGFAGKATTLHVPLSFDKANSTREERFAACDRSIYGFYGVHGGTEPDRNAQGAGQVDELWILDVNGATVILDATYSPATPTALVDELRTLAMSATFK